MSTNMASICPCLPTTGIFPYSFIMSSVLQFLLVVCVLWAVVGGCGGLKRDGQRGTPGGGASFCTAGRDIFVFSPPSLWKEGKDQMKYLQMA